MRGSKKLSNIIDLVIHQIEDMPHSVYRSKSSSSVYIKFKHGTLSIRDHAPKNSSPRWNIIIGYRGKKRRRVRNNRTAYFYSEYNMLDCLIDIRNLRCNNKKTKGR